MFDLSDMDEADQNALRYGPHRPADHYLAARFDEAMRRKDLIRHVDDQMLVVEKNRTFLGRRIQRVVTYKAKFQPPTPRFNRSPFDRGG